MTRAKGMTRPALIPVWLFRIWTFGAARECRDCHQWFYGVLTSGGRCANCDLAVFERLLETELKAHEQHLRAMLELSLERLEIEHAREQHRRATERAWLEYRTYLDRGEYDKANEALGKALAPPPLRDRVEFGDE